MEQEEIEEHIEFLEKMGRPDKLTIGQAEDYFAVLICLRKHKEEHTWKMICPCCSECTCCV